MKKDWRKAASDMRKYARAMKRDPALRDKMYGLGATTRLQEPPNTRATAKDDPNG
jgi:hypothetical protein